MSETKEMFCLSALENLLKGYFNESEYCLNGEKESAVCLERKDSFWEVFEKEKNSFNDKCVFGNVVEACLNIIDRMFLSQADEAKSRFLDTIISSKSA